MQTLGEPYIHFYQSATEKTFVFEDVPASDGSFETAPVGLDDGLNYWSGQGPWPGWIVMSDPWLTNGDPAAYARDHTRTQIVAWIHQVVSLSKPAETTVAAKARWAGRCLR